MTTKKQKCCFTIIVIPHSEESTFSLRLPPYAVQIAIFIIALIISGLGLLCYSYLKVSADASHLKELHQRNRAQQEEIDALAIETQKAKKQNREMNNLIENITAAVEDIEILDGVEVISDEKEETMKEMPPSYSANPHFEYLTDESFDRPNSSISRSASPAVTSFTSFEQLHENTSTSGMILDRAVENIANLRSEIPENLDALDDIETYATKIETKLEKVEFKPSLWPARGRITSGFGTRKTPYSSGYQFHSGVDIAGSHGSKIRSAANGEVTFAGYRGSLGNLLIINHGNDYETYYAHLDDFTVGKGDKVEKGETIGYMGSSGRTTGTHLHYEVHHKGSPVNPKSYLEEH